MHLFTTVIFFPVCTDMDMHSHDMGDPLLLVTPFCLLHQPANAHRANTGMGSDRNTNKWEINDSGAESGRTRSRTPATTQTWRPAINASRNNPCRLPQGSAESAGTVWRSIKVWEAQIWIVPFDPFISTYNMKSPRIHLKYCSVLCVY